jgi:hypothetical protein
MEIQSQWKPWQQTVLQLSQTPMKERERLCIEVFVIDSENVPDKEAIIKELCNRKIGTHFHSDIYGRKLSQVALELPKTACYLIEWPNTNNEDKIYESFAMMEDLRDGVAFDTRWKFRSEYFEPPRVFVFAEKIPDKKLLEIYGGKIKVWHVKDNRIQIKID